MKKILLILSLLLLGQKSFANLDKEIDIAFSEASREYLIDFQLLKSVAYASSGLNPYYVQIGDAGLIFLDEEAANTIAKNKGWLLRLIYGNNYQYIVIPQAGDINEYISKYGDSRDYSITKINKRKLKIGLMGLTPYNSSVGDLLKLTENTLIGTKRFKNSIKKLGLKNALHNYCDCQNSIEFVGRIARYYSEQTGKELDSLYRK